MFQIGRCYKSGGVSNRKIAHGALKKVKKMWLKPIDAPLHFTENDEEDIDELYRNEIVIDNN